MPVRSKGPKWEVDVAYSRALPAWRRVRKTVDSKEEGEQLLLIILDSLKRYGKWPVTKGDRPLAALPRSPRRPSRGGSLRHAAELAIRYRYAGTAYGRVVEQIIWPMVEWFEIKGCHDLDNIETRHIEAFIDWRREQGNSPSTINKYLSLLSVINTTGLERKPPLCESRLVFKRQRVVRREKWWLRPEKLDELTKWLELNGEGLYADYVRMICYQGFRPEEALRLEARHFIGLHSDEPSVQVPGTKTKKSGNAIPVFDLAIPVVVRCIERAQRGGWSMLFPFTKRRARELWNDCRDYLGVADLASSTQRALRRTFGAYATARGMPTKTLQEIYRHETITTTEGYLDLIGNERLDEARRIMRGGAEGLPGRATERLSIALAAYRIAGATPDESAHFARAFMDLERAEQGASEAAG